MTDDANNSLNSNVKHKNIKNSIEGTVKLNKIEADTNIGEEISVNQPFNIKKDYIGKQKSHSSRIPYFALTLFLSVFTFTIILIMLPFMGIMEISFFGIVLLPKDTYMNLLEAIVTTSDITNLWNNNPLALFGIIVIFILIVAVIIKFVSEFKEPQTEFDQQQTNGSITYFNFTKLLSRVRLIFIKPTNDKNSDVIKEFMGTVFNFSTDAKSTNAVYCVPDKRNSKNNQGNFFLEFPECFDITNIRQYLSEHSWITLASNLAMTITVTILVVGTLLNIALNIITQAQLNPYLIFGFTSWISLSAIISISTVLVWALKEITGSYGVFRIIKVSSSPLDIDRYLVIPYYYDGVSGSEIDTILATYMQFNNTKIEKKNSVVPATIHGPNISNSLVNLDENAEIEILDEEQEKLSPMNDLNTFNFDLSELHTSEYYIAEIDQLKSRNKTLEMEKDHALLVVSQLAEANTNLKKAMRARKSIDYSDIRSLSSLQDSSSPQPQSQVDRVHIQDNNSTSPRQNNSYLLPMIIIGIIGAIAIYWASISFTQTEFLILIVVGIAFIIVVVLAVGLIFLRQYLNESSSGKNIRFG